MITLLRAESYRWVQRRGLWVGAIVALVFTVGPALLMLLSAVPPNEQDVARAAAEYDRYLQEWEAGHAEWYAECLSSAAVSSEGAGGDGAVGCAEINTRPLAEDWIPQPMRWDDGVKIAGLIGSGVGGFVVLIAAASFWGAEFRQGTISTWLTFVPNRTRVWLAKFTVAVTAGVLTVVLLNLVALLVVGIGIAILQGATGIGGFAAIPAIVGRGALFGALTSLLGAAVAVLFRSTIAAAVLPVAYVFAGIFGSLMLLLPGAESIQPLMPGMNISALLEGGTTYHVPERIVTESGIDTTYVERHLSFLHGVVYVGTITAAATLASLLVFQRRDVTD